MNDEQYSLIVNTLKQMYSCGKTGLEKIRAMYNKKALSLEEYNYIIGKEDEK